MMTSYTLRKMTVVAPEVTNAGQPSGYADAFADLLDELEQNYTRRAPHVGSWNGTRESGVTFEILAAPDMLPLELLAHAAREAMPDQDAIQITDEGQVEVYEA